MSWLTNALASMAIGASTTFQFERDSSVASEPQLSKLATIPTNWNGG